MSTNIYSTSDDIATKSGCFPYVWYKLKSESRTDEKEEVIAQFLEFVRTNSIEWAKAGQIVASKDNILESDDYQQYPQSFFTSTSEEEDTLLYL